MSWLLLPPELWAQIFSLLPAASLCSVSLVCLYFRELTRDPTLWRNVTVSKAAIQRLGLQSLLQCERLRLVERLDLSYLDLTAAGVESLVRVVGGLEAVSLRYCHLTHQQLSCLLSSLSSSRLSQLSLDSVSLSQVEEESLARAVLARQVVNLNNTGLTSSQLRLLLLQSPASHLHSLTLSGLDLSSLPPHLLQLAVLKVRHLDLANSELRPQQLTALLTEVIWSNNIEELELTGAQLDTDSVSSQLLTDSLACLTSVNLTSSSLNTSQLVSVLSSPSLDWSTLSQLNLSTLDLTRLPSSLLASTTAGLTSLKINYSKITREQLTALVRALARADRLEVLGENLIRTCLQLF